MARSSSDETMSAASNSRAARVVLPAPAAPISTTRLGTARRIRIGVGSTASGVTGSVRSAERDVGLIFVGVDHAESPAARESGDRDRARLGELAEVVVRAPELPLEPRAGQQPEQRPDDLAGE